MAIGINFIDLEWTEATDNIGIAGYTIYKSEDNITFDDGIEVGNVLFYQYTGLEEYTQYWFKQKATDVNGNVSEFGNTVSETTAVDLQIPTGINLEEL